MFWTALVSCNLFVGSKAGSRIEGKVGNTVQVTAGCSGFAAAQVSSAAALRLVDQRGW